MNNDLWIIKHLVLLRILIIFLHRSHVIFRCLLQPFFDMLPLLNYQYSNTDSISFIVVEFEGWSWDFFGCGKLFIFFLEFIEPGTDFTLMGLRFWDVEAFSDALMTVDEIDFISFKFIFSF